MKSRKNVFIKVAPGVKRMLMKEIWTVIRLAMGITSIARVDDEVTVNSEADAFALDLVWFDANDDVERGVLTACGLLGLPNKTDGFGTTELSSSDTTGWPATFVVEGVNPSVCLLLCRALGRAGRLPW
jgi:hypothetical protein